MPVKPNDPADYRTKRRQRIIQISLVVALAAACFAIAVSKDSTVATVITEAEKEFAGEQNRMFPISLPEIFGKYQLRAAGNNLVVVGDTYVYIYNSKGDLIKSIRHKCSSPTVVIGETRLLVYDKDSLQCDIYLLNGEHILTQKLDNVVINAAFAPDGSFAVLTAFESYANCLYVFDKNGGDYLYRRKFKEYVTAMNFADKSTLSLTTVDLSQASTISNLLTLNLDGEESDELVEVGNFAEDSFPFFSTYQFGKYVSLCENSVYSFNAETSAQASYSFYGNLLDFCVADNIIAILINDVALKQIKLVTMDLDCNVLGFKVVQDAKKIEISGAGIYVLSSNGVKTYDITLSEEINTNESEAMTDSADEVNDTYSDLVATPNGVYLIGSRTLVKNN